MGIDIGDLSTVILCQVPPGQAQYIQRVGRAGRKDGNAFTVTVAGTKQHDLYFYQGGKSNNELWCFNSDQATLVADDVKQIWQNNDKLEILTTTGKARIISLGK